MGINTTGTCPILCINIINILVERAVFMQRYAMMSGECKAEEEDQRQLSSNKDRYPQVPPPTPTKPRL